MAGVHELETLFIRLKGDASNYLAMLDEVIKKTKAAAVDIKKSLSQGRRAPKAVLPKQDPAVKQAEETAAKVEKIKAPRKSRALPPEEKARRAAERAEARKASKEVVTVAKNSQESAAKITARQQKAESRAAKRAAQEAEYEAERKRKLADNSARLATKQGEQADRARQRLRDNSARLASRQGEKADKEQQALNKDRAKKAEQTAKQAAAREVAAINRRVNAAGKAGKEQEIQRQKAENKAQADRKLQARQAEQTAKQGAAREIAEINRRVNAAGKAGKQQERRRQTEENQAAARTKAATKQRETLMANYAKVHTRIMEREQRQREAAVKRSNKQQAADATKAQRNIQQEHARTSQAISDLARNATMVGAAQAAAFTASMTALGKASLDAFSDFNLGMTEATSIMSDGTENAREMANVAKELSLSTKFGAAESAKAYYNLASAGLSAQQSIKALPQVQAFATAGAFDLAKATELSTSAQTALGMRVKDADQNLQNLTRVTDALTEANNMVQGTTLDFSLALTTDAAATARIYNKELEEVVATLMVYAEQGIKGRLAGGHFARSLRLLGSAATRHAEEHKQLGFSLYDEAGQMKSMQGIVQNLEQVLKGLTPQAKAAVLATLGFDALQQKAILPLIGMSDKLGTYRQHLIDIIGLDKTQLVATKQMEAFAHQMTIVKNAVNLVAIEIGEILAPLMLGFGSIIKDAVGAFRDLTPATKAAIVSVAVFTTVFVALSGVVLAALYAINVFSAGALIIAGAIITSFAAAGATVGLLVNHLGGFAKVFESLKKKGEETWVWLKPVREALSELAYTMMVELGAVFDHLIKLGSEAFSVRDWESMKTALIDGIELVEFSLINFDRTARLIFGGLVIEANKLLNVTIAMAPILQGISQMATGIQFPIPQLTPANIGELQKDLDKLANELGGDFAQFQMKRAAQRLQDAFAEQFWQDVETEAWQKELINKMEAMAEGAGKGGEDAGDKWNDGMNKSLKKFKIDAALFGSAEALGRISEYTERILNPEAFQTKKGRPSNLPKMDIVNRQAGANTEVDLLREIRDNLKQQNRGPDVRVRPADIG